MIERRMSDARLRQIRKKENEVNLMKEKIIKLIEEVLKVPAGTITEDTMIEDVEQWDSLAHVMIIGQLEEELGVSIPLEEAIELKGMRELLEKAGCE
jgi:acyl carrier protein